MLKVYEAKYYVSIDGGEFRQVEEKCYPYVLRDDNEPKALFLCLQVKQERFV